MPLNARAAGPIDPADDLLFLRLQGSYAGAVTRLDAGVGRLLERLVALNPDDDVLIVCTADCGQPLGEHGVVGPVPATAHEETTHLPLILRLPDADEAGRRVAALTQAADLAATLADVFEVELPSAHGRSLLPSVYGEGEEVHRYVCSGVQSGEAVEWSLRTPEWAFLLPVRPHPDGPSSGARLYVKPDDRREVNNVLQHHQERAEGLERTLRGFVAATQRPGPLEAPALPETEAPAPPPTAPMLN
jgi:arylsulfatase A-like enzyme